MRLSRLLVCLLLAGTGAAPAFAQETAVNVPIQSIGLFKNGLAVVRRHVTVPGPGVYRIENVPAPVHGTFFVESAATVSATVTTREVEIPADDVEGLDLQRALAGKTVTIYFRDAGLVPVIGTVVAPQPAADRTGTPSSVARFLILQTTTGRSYVDTATIAHVAANGQASSIKTRKPVLLLTVEGGRPGNIDISVMYLTTGIGWAPSYRVDFSNAARLRIEQQAVIRNELEDFAADVRLISGFPNVPFANVLSPLSSGSTWASFFRQLSSRMSAGTNSSVLTQTVVSNRSDSPENIVDMSTLLSESAVDLHYQSIGRRSLNRGDVVSLAVGAAEAAYERIVEWVVPDTRTPEGRRVQEYSVQPAVSPEDGAWDAVRFKNPLPFPMTTAPATITNGSAFNGQTTSSFVNMGEQATLRITKALSIRTQSTEQEVAAPARDVVRVGSAEYRRVSVQGELSVANHRATAVTVVVRRQFSGDLTTAGAEPRVTLLESGVYAVNKRHELAWTMVMAPGEVRTLPYAYSVLVRN